MDLDEVLYKMAKNTVVLQYLDCFILLHASIVQNIAKSVVLIVLSRAGDLITSKNLPLRSPCSPLAVLCLSLEQELRLISSQETLLSFLCMKITAQALTSYCSLCD